MKIKSILLSCILCFSSAAIPFSQVSATGIPTFDASNFANMINSAVNQATQISNQVQQINGILRGNALSEQALKQLGLGNYSGIIRQMNSQYQDLNKVLTASKNLSASVSDVQAQFKQLYPSFQSMKNQTPTQRYQQFSQWSDQLQSANQSAMQTQTTINNIKDRNDQIKSILMDSAGANGASQVAQIQSSNQMLGVLAQQMNDLNSVVASSSRASIQAQAAAQAEKDAMKQEWMKRNDTSNYQTSIGSNQFY
ncbi:conjugal transfer protein TrbJ (plasmid) [Acinetobacter sp. ESL0695]|uniref:type IV secretion system protein n=1 Tax=Acinetobacter sp. ESL0695 TaxID=2983215 RepID=UPI0023F2959E|nr:conjugal transfer protein TrbJ [Acinetobacter sp. ESL0695]WEV50249.1 conjugal transfer protein TrbJ [Acinetobacter sp. ESL0695]